MKDCDANGPELKDTSGTCIRKYFKSSPTTWISSDWSWTGKDEQNALECLKNKSWKLATVPSYLAPPKISSSLAPSGIRSSGRITKKPDLLVACASLPKTATPAEPTPAATAKRIGGHGQAAGKRKATKKTSAGPPKKKSKLADEVDESVLAVMYEAAMRAAEENAAEEARRIAAENEKAKRAGAAAGGGGVVSVSGGGTCPAGPAGPAGAADPRGPPGPPGPCASPSNAGEARLTAKEFSDFAAAGAFQNGQTWQNLAI